MLTLYVSSLLLLGHVCVTQARPGSSNCTMWVEWTQCTGFPGTRERYRSCVHEVLEIAHEEPSSHSHSNDNDIPWCEGEEREVVHCFESCPICKDNRDCDDLPGSQCYNSSVLKDCCHTCEDHEVQLPIADCKYGDHIDTCDVQDGRQCYNTTVLKQCCATCHGYDTQIPDCKYGNKKPFCRVELCSNYTLVDRADCCKTCKGSFINNTQQAYTGVPRTTWWPTLEGPVAVTEGLKNKADTESLPDWVVPTVTTGGLALLVLAVILAVFILRRSRKRSAAKSSSLSMATVDSNLSHRAPVPLPRPDSTKAESVREQTPSEEYDYIGQEYIEHADRNDPLPLAPREYLTWDDPNAPYRRVLCSKELNDLHDDVANPTVYTSAPKNRHQFDEVEGKVVPNGRQSPYEASEYARLESSQREARRLNTYKLFPTLKGTEEHQTEEQQSMRE